MGVVMNIAGLSTKGNEVIGPLLQDLCFRIASNIFDDEETRSAEIEAELSNVVYCAKELGRPEVFEELIAESIMKRLRLFMNEAGMSVEDFESIEYPFDLSERGL